MSAKMITTTAVEKASASVINILAFGCIVWPFMNYLSVASCCVLFFLFQSLFFLRDDKRDIGMLIVGSRYERGYSRRQYLLYTCLYTFSVMTVFYPGIFALNMLMQIACIMMTGTTIHGYLAGEIKTVRSRGDYK